MTPAQINSLPGLVEEVERCRAFKRSMTEQEREIFARAKELGFDGKALRKVIQRRAEDPEKREAFEAIVEEYEHALGGKKAAADDLAAGAGVRETARRHRISVGAASALKKGVQKIESSEPAHDPETGEVIESAAAPTPNGERREPPPEADAAPAAEPECKMTGPDGETIWSGSTQQLREAADAVRAGKLKPILSPSLSAGLAPTTASAEDMPPLPVRRKRSA